MSAPRRRTTYRVITSGILRKTSWDPEGVWIPSKETKATSKQDAIDKARTKQRVHERTPTQFPPVLKVVRRREERFVIANIPTWVVIKETEIDWTKEENKGNPNMLSKDEEPRKLEYRLPFTLVQKTGRELAKMADCPLEYMYVGGTQSPESEKLPKIDSDVDFFCFRPEFSG
ncbi:unnamed protein product, partial [marine sediment metagenome]